MYFADAPIMHASSEFMTYACICRATYSICIRGRYVGQWLGISLAYATRGSAVSSGSASAGVWLDLIPHDMHAYDVGACGR
jgi:hypothetical protein